MTSKEINSLIKSKTITSKALKIDLASGNSKVGPDWLGIDILNFPAVDIVHDLEVFPWPLPNECATLLLASHLLEHINPHKGVFVNFMNEAWRILKPDGEFAITVPYAGSYGFWQDPTHCNGINEATFYYFDPLHESGYYRFYHPRPWKIKECIWHATGNLETVLIKRRDDPSYYEDIAR